MLIGEEEGTTDKVTETPSLNNTTSAVIPETTVTVESSSNTTAPNDTNPPAPEVTTYYNIITAEERDMLATLCYLEASTCSPECQRAVVSVIFNRLESGKWRKDMNKDGVKLHYTILCTILTHSAPLYL